MGKYLRWVRANDGFNTSERLHKALKCVLKKQQLRDATLCALRLWEMSVHTYCRRISLSAVLLQSLTCAKSEIRRRCFRVRGEKATTSLLLVANDATYASEKFHDLEWRIAIRESQIESLSSFPPEQTLQVSQ